MASIWPYPGSIRRYLGCAGIPSLVVLVGGGCSIVIPGRLATAVRGVVASNGAFAALLLGGGSPRGLMGPRFA